MSLISTPWELGGPNTGMEMGLTGTLFNTESQRAHGGQGAPGGQSEDQDGQNGREVLCGGDEEGRRPYCPVLRMVRYLLCFKGTMPQTKPDTMPQLI